MLAAAPRTTAPASPCATPITPPCSPRTQATAGPPSTAPSTAPSPSLLDFATVFDDVYDDALPVDVGLLRIVGETVVAQEKAVDAAARPSKRIRKTIAAPTATEDAGAVVDTSVDDARVVHAWLATYYPDEQSAATTTAGPLPLSTAYAYWVHAHIETDAQYDTVVVAQDPVALHAAIDADLPRLAALSGGGGPPSYTVTTLDARGLSRWIRGSVARASVPVGRAWKRV